MCTKVPCRCSCLSLRAAIANKEIEVKAVSDLFMGLKILAYQVQYDSLQERLPGTTTCIDCHADRHGHRWAQSLGFLRGLLQRGG